jgi:hypothetical protein
MPSDVNNLILSEVVPLAPCVCWSGDHSLALPADNKTLFSFIKDMFERGDSLLRVHKFVDGVFRAYVAVLTPHRLTWLPDSAIVGGAQLPTYHPKYKIIADIEDIPAAVIATHVQLHSPSFGLFLIQYEKAEGNLFLAATDQGLLLSIKQSGTSPSDLLYQLFRQCSDTDGYLFLRRFKPEPPHEIYYASCVDGHLRWRDEMDTFDKYQAALQRNLEAGLLGVEHADQLSEAFEPCTFFH